MEQNLLPVHAVRCVRRALCALFLAASFTCCAMHCAFADEPKSKIPTRPPAPAKPARAPAYREDVLLVMPQRGADAKEVMQIFNDMHGEVLETIGEDELTCYVIKVEKGKLFECERKLGKDKHFSAVQRDYVFQAH